MKTLSAMEKWSYATGNIPFAVKDAAFANFVVFYYTQVHGLSGTLAGLAMFFALLFDAVSDPVVGSWSDTFRSRWGRRHPLLIAGGVPTALLFLGLFVPPSGFGELGIFAWLLCVSVLLRTFLTIYFIPYIAMGAELSSDYDERTVIAKARVTIAWIAGMLLPAIAYALLFKSSGEVDGRLIAENYWRYGVLSALMAGVAVLVCVVGTRSVIPRLPLAAGGRAFRWQDPIRDFVIAASNRNFKVSVGANLAFGLSTGVYTTLALYLGTYFWGMSSQQLAGLVVPTAAATLVSFTTLSHLGKRFDKPQVLAGASMVLAINAVWFIGSRLLGVLPGNSSDLIYALLCLNTFIGVLMIVTIQVMGASLAADIIDELQQSTGHRKDGVVFAAQAFVLKATTGAGALIAGVVIDISGIPSGAAPGSVHSGALQSLGLFSVITIGGLAVLAFAFNRRLKLGRDDHSAIQAELVAAAAATKA
ncbi:MFS transporter [Congregibacter sp.]|uniref:MFS transporter n=1 Tax=Congregibacter sp. TaxID=2744308 RepID=UPI003F6D8697